MNARARFDTGSTFRAVGIGARLMAVFTVVLGVLYPLLVTGVGQLIMPGRADGSLLRDSSGAVVGSSLIGQSFADADGNPLPAYFQPRPSAAGEGYDAGASSGSNQGPENQDLIDAIKARRTQVADFNGVSEDAVPPDAVTASGSGLDPHISPSYAAIQVDRVARARGLTKAEVARVLAAHTDARDLGYLGERRVNVLELNLALDRLTTTR